MTPTSQGISRPARWSLALGALPTKAKPFTPAVVVALTVVNFGAAVVAARVAGFGGPWLWNLEMPGFDYPWAVFFHEALQQQQLPLWNDRLGMGFPLYAEGQIGAFYPINWILFQLPPLVALDQARVVHLVFLGVGTGLLAMRLSGSRMAGLLAGPAIVLSGGVVSKLEWTNLVQSFAFVPWILLPLVRRPHPTRTGVAVAGVLLGIQVLPLHPNVSLLTAITVALVLVTIRPRWDTLPRLVAVGVIAAGIGAVQLVPSAILWTQSTRLSGLTSGDLFRHTAMPYDLLGTAFANVFVRSDPNGQNLLSTWIPTGAWGTLEGGSYVGLGAMVLAASMIRHRRARPFIVVGVFMIVLPVIGALRPSLWAAIPIWNGLHAPVKAYLFLDLMVVVVSAMALARLRHRRLDIRLPSVVAVILIGGYVVLAAIVLLAPTLFLELVTRYWTSTPAGGPPSVVALAQAVFSSPWPVILEVAIAVAIIGLMRSAISARRGLIVALVVGSLALLTPSINRVATIGEFDVSSAGSVRAISALRPHRALTTGPEWWIGTPNRFAAAGIPDIAMFSSLSLGATESLVHQLRESDPDQLAARAAGIDTVVTYGETCAGTEVSRIENVSICRLDSPRPPYWIPRTVAERGPGSPSAIQPTGAKFYVDRALAEAVPADVIAWSSTAARFNVDAPADGWLYIDRAWWPGWQVSIDGVPQRVDRALSGQLVEMPAGRHDVEQSLVLWDVTLGLLISLTTLAVVTVWLIRPRWFRVAASTGASIAAPLRRPHPRWASPHVDRTRLQAIGYAAGWTIAILALLIAVDKAVDPRFLNLVDWHTYEGARTRALAGEPLYPNYQLTGPFSLADATEQEGFVYSPVTAFLMVPLGVGGPGVWIGLCLVAFVVGLAAALRRSPLWLLVGGPVLIAAQGGLETGIRVANVDVMVAGVVPLTVFGRVAVVNAILGAAKVWAGALLLVEVRERRWRTLAVAIGVAGVLIIASAAVFGVQAWIDWVRTLANARPVCEGTVPTFGPSFSCSLPFGQRIGAAIGWVVAGLLLLGALKVRSKGLAVFLITLAMLAASPDVSDRYWLIAIMGAITYFAYRGQTLRQIAVTEYGRLDVLLRRQRSSAGRA